MSIQYGSVSFKGNCCLARRMLRSQQSGSASKASWKAQSEQWGQQQSKQKQFHTLESAYAPGTDEGRGSWFPGGIMLIKIYCLVIFPYFSFLLRLENMPCRHSPRRAVLYNSARHIHPLHPKSAPPAHVTLPGHHTGANFPQ